MRAVAALSLILILPFTTIPCIHSLPPACSSFLFSAAQIQFSSNSSLPPGYTPPSSPPRPSQLLSPTEVLDVQTGHMCPLPSIHMLRPYWLPCHSSPTFPHIPHMAPFPSPSSWHRGRLRPIEKSGSIPRLSALTLSGPPCHTPPMHTVTHSPTALLRDSKAPLPP